MAEPGSSHPDRALALAFRYLNRRERTSTEMRAHLLERDIDPDAVEAALGELTEQGYLDDVRFAQLFVQDKRNLQEWGRDRISRELRARGIDRELTEAALADRGQEGELELALSLLRRRFPAGTADRHQRERALGVLLRKGYGYEVAQLAVTSHHSS